MSAYNRDNANVFGVLPYPSKSKLIDLNWKKFNILHMQEEYLFISIEAHVKHDMTIMEILTYKPKYFIHIMSSLDCLRE